MSDQPQTVCLPVELLNQIDAALKRSYTAALVVKGTLNQPYVDAPEWTPWTRWVEPAARQAHDARQGLRKARAEASLLDRAIANVEREARS